MDQLPSKKNDPLKRLINPSLLDDAPANIAEQVLSKINTASVAFRNYKPVISKPVWISISVIFSILVIATFLFPGGSEHWTVYGQEINKPDYSLPQINWMPFQFGINSGLIIALLLSVLSVLYFDKFLKKFI